MTRESGAATRVGSRAVHGQIIGNDRCESADLDDYAPQSLSATQGAGWRNALRTHLVPIAIVAAFSGGPSLRQYRRFDSLNAATPIEAFAWNYVEDLWEPMPELITNDQVRALNRLLAVPYTNDPGFQYFADD